MANNKAGSIIFLFFIFIQHIVASYPPTPTPPLSLFNESTSVWLFHKIICTQYSAVYKMVTLMAGMVAYSGPVSVCEEQINSLIAFIF